ncbi:Leucine rich repeat containing protein [Chondrus crispus]|uniref:Leucine rich repeat containing protein n=1 Tax=Chondrus crispus TaxID=2769 RepID=R7QSZ0_CHOCR|nr:Leucine rich repeat containing protein [Chondrus crispus]CDF40631.1 Leucine rich repeat containing protein [Chondrus crispus]|eukprot:XP_005710925.1 Leucine rich repeat containing protein [Chondrus crispus]
MTDGDLDLIAERSAGSLQSLRISPSYFITASGLLSFAKSCPNLVALHMTRCEYMTDRKLGEIVLVCPTLEDISVSRCWQIRGRKLHDKLRPVQKKLKRLDISVTGVLNLQMAKFMKGYPALEVINAGDCHMLQEEYRRSDPSSSFPNLAYLNLDRTDFVAQTWLKLTCMTSKNLRFLSLNMLRSKIYRIEEILDVELPPLKYLGLAGQDITDPMWQMIYEKLGKSLIQCDLSRNKSLSGALVVRDGNFSVLECLSLRGTRITSENLESLINLAPRLKSLDLSGCRWVERALRRTPFSFKEQASTKGGKQ